MVHLHDCEQGSRKWDLLRENRYTGSNADKLLKYGAIDYALNRSNTFKGNFHTERGHLLENEAIELFEKIKGISVLKTGFVTNDLYPNCGYSPDFLLPNILGEVKCFSEPNHMQLINAKRIEDIPFKILAQIYFGMFICELPLAYLIPYNPKIKEVKNRFKIIEIKRKKAIDNNFKRILKVG